MTANHIYLLLSILIASGVIGGGGLRTGAGIYKRARAIEHFAENVSAMLTSHQDTLANHEGRLTVLEGTTPQWTSPTPPSPPQPSPRTPQAPAGGAAPLTWGLPPRPTR